MIHSNNGLVHPHDGSNYQDATPPNELRHDHISNRQRNPAHSEPDNNRFICDISDFPPIREASDEKNDIEPDKRQKAEKPHIHKNRKIAIVNIIPRIPTIYSYSHSRQWGPVQG